MGTTQHAEHTQLGAPLEGAAREKGRRVSSLDIFRGITILLMLVVNNTALDDFTPAALTHGDWSGEVRLADLVFPWFLLAAGASLALSALRRREKGATLASEAPRVLQRGAILFGLGLAVDACITRQLVFGLGVLQLIALSYVLGAFLQRTPGWTRVGVVVIGCAANWALLRHLPQGASAPGTILESANAFKAINDSFLEPLHLRGLTSLFTTVPLVLLGGFAGEALSGGGRKAWLRVAMFGAVLAGIGLALSLDQPMIKPIWTSSYVLFVGGLGTVLLGILQLACGDESPKWGLPWVVYGSNPILAYVMPVVVKTAVFRSINVAPGLALDAALIQWPKVWLGPVAGGILYMACYAGVWWLVLYWLYRKKIFLRA